MKRLKKHRIKREAPETSHSRNEEHDLAYYIHDRVELMHQVFSVLKQKELRTMAPECVRHISIDDLQELCTEELLGISSKRLCAILDGADPPSNTESSSSSPERMETISLDSISSDEEILSQASSKRTKKHKHRHRSKRNQEAGTSDTTASRAGLTVLELLELQARARAIRAQLQRAPPPTESASIEQDGPSSDDEVVIKEEAPEVVTISSDDEKPSVQELEKNIQQSTEKSSDNAKTVTKRINDLIITVPQSKPTRKIKLNRTKSIRNDETPTVSKPVENIAKDNIKEVKDKKAKKKQKKKDKSQSKAGSDQDEITLQLSDTEKMDLLEDLDRKNVSSEDSESSSDSEVSSSSSDDDKPKDKDTSAEKKEISKSLNHGDEGPKDSTKFSKDSNGIEKDEISKDSIEKIDSPVKDTVAINSDKDSTVSVEQSNEDVVNVIYKDKDNKKDSNMDIECISVTDQNTSEVNEVSVKDTDKMEVDESEKDIDITENTDEKSKDVSDSKDIEEGEITDQNKNLSDGEISQESEKDTSLEKDVTQNKDKSKDKDMNQDKIKSQDNTQDVVCISDDEKKSKKKKKEKKKKSKKSDFRESSDQNFYKQDTDSKTKTDNLEILVVTDDKDEDEKDTDKEIQDITDDKDIKDANKTDNDDVFEYLELSDDSSCYEVEGVSVLSKEPTAREIAALSAKIDDLQRTDVVTDEEIRQFEDNQQIQDVSWKDRYLNSKKVKSVLNTSTILNALRKKNIEIKKKLEESKQEMEIVEERTEDKVIDVVEGSIDHYNKLQGSTKFVDPVKEKIEGDKVSKEMEKDAKQLLKMYKKLLKYNDINKKKDPNKKKKKKQKKNKDKDKNKT